MKGAGINIYNPKRKNVARAIKEIEKEVDRMGKREFREIEHFAKEAGAKGITAESSKKLVKGLLESARKFVLKSGMKGVERDLEHGVRDVEREAKHAM